MLYSVIKGRWKYHEKRFYHSYGLLKNKVPQLFLSGKISRNFICPSRNNSGRKLQKNICSKS